MTGAICVQANTAAGRVIRAMVRSFMPDSAIACSPAAAQAVTWRESDLRRPRAALDRSMARPRGVPLADLRARSRALRRTGADRREAGGYVLVATLTEDGSTRCSGLPVCRYNPEGRHAEFDGAFRLLESVREGQVTPSGQLGRRLHRPVVIAGGAAPFQGDGVPLDCLFQLDGDVALASGAARGNFQGKTTSHTPNLNSSIANSSIAPPVGLVRLVVTAPLWPERTLTLPAQRGRDVGAQSRGFRDQVVQPVDQPLEVPFFQ